MGLYFLILLCSSEVAVYAYAAAQVKKAMEVGGSVQAIFTKRAMWI